MMARTSGNAPSPKPVSTAQRTGRANGAQSRPRYPAASATPTRTNADRSRAAVLVSGIRTKVEGTPTISASPSMTPARSGLIPWSDRTVGSQPMTA